MSLVSYDLGITDNFNNITAYESLLPTKELVKSSEDSSVSIYDLLYYAPSIEAKQATFVTYPVYLTIKSELESEGLKIAESEQEMIGDEILLTFEIAETDSNIDEIEYNLIKKHNLNEKKVTLTIY